MPLIERKKRLAKVVGRRQSGVIRYSDHVVAGGAALFASACKDGLEGIVSKKVDAPYVDLRSASCRDFGTSPLEAQTIADLLWAGFGVNRPDDGGIANLDHSQYAGPILAHSQSGD